ncbi:MAG: prolipoprotein diacylglyceryl transferase [Erysipelotrichia bacterium]|nr:prolipoprotein diacylglyceryl transferase [Erysipelotrichia bacterium]
MILALIFMAAFAALTGFGIYQTVNFIKSPIAAKNYRSFIYKQLVFISVAAVAFLVMSLGFYSWLKATPSPLYVVQLVIGGLLFPLTLLVAIHSFMIHHHDKETPQPLDKWVYRLTIIGFITALIFFFVYTNGLAPYLTYPLVNGLSFREGFVTPDSATHPNLAFYAICILIGAILVYVICDHYMYKEYGEHGLLESTFLVAFPAGIIGARLWYVVGNWSIEFANRPWWSMFEIWNGGLTILGGALMGIIIGAIFYRWRHKDKPISFAFDLIVPAILLAQAIGRIGNFFNCEVHGLLSSLENWKWLPEIIWRNLSYSSVEGLAPAGQVYVPLFLIESLANIGGYFIITQLFGRLLKKYTEPGDLGLGYIVWYGLIRSLMEPLRSSIFQMGENGYWSWIWSMAFVLFGTLAIVANHVIRYVISKKNKTYKVEAKTKDKSFIATVVIGGISAIFLAVGLFLMTSNQFVAKVEYNGFNVGVMLLITGISLLSLMTISIFKLIEGYKTYETV